MSLSGSISNEWRSLDEETRTKWSKLALRDCIFHRALESPYITTQPEALAYCQCAHPAPRFSTRKARSSLIPCHVVNPLELFTRIHLTIGGVAVVGVWKPRTLPPHASIVMPSARQMNHHHGIGDYISSRRILTQEAARVSADALLSQIIGHISACKIE